MKIDFVRATFGFIIFALFVERITGVLVEDVLPCFEDIVRQKYRCFWFPEVKGKILDLVPKCESFNSDLALIDSQSLSDHIEDNLKSPITEFYFGVSLSDMNLWTDWSQTTPLAWTNWNREPSSGDECVYADPYLKWHPSDCLKSSLHTLCEDRELHFLPCFQDNGRERCFWATKKKGNIQDLQEECETRSSSLVVIDSLELSDYIKQELPSYVTQITQHFAVGVKKDAFGKWKTFNEEDLEFTNWDKGIPPSPSDKDCVFADESKDLVWFDIRCDVTSQFGICEIKPDDITTTTTSLNTVTTTTPFITESTQTTKILSTTVTSYKIISTVEQTTANLSSIPSNDTKTASRKEATTEGTSNLTTNETPDSQTVTSNVSMTPINTSTSTQLMVRNSTNSTDSALTPTTIDHDTSISDLNQTTITSAPSTTEDTTAVDLTSPTTITTTSLSTTTTSDFTTTTALDTTTKEIPAQSVVTNSTNSDDSVSTPTTVGHDTSTSDLSQTTITSTSSPIEDTVTTTVNSTSKTTPTATVSTATTSDFTTATSSGTTKKRPASAKVGKHRIIIPHRCIGPPCKVVPTKKLQTKIARLQDALKVNRNTSRYHRKRHTMYDPRPSASAIGVTFFVGFLSIYVWVILDEILKRRRRRKHRLNLAKRKQTVRST